MSTFLLSYFPTICLFAEDAIVMFHFSCKGSTSKASYRHFSSTFSQNPLFCKIFIIYLRHVPKGAWHILLICLWNHHLEERSKPEHGLSPPLMGVGSPYHVQVCGEPQRRMELSYAFSFDLVRRPKMKILSSIIRADGRW